VIPYRVLYRLGLAPWERRDVDATWRQLTSGPQALPPGRALDVGCGRGRDAVYLAKHDWRVSAVDFDERALAAARQRAAREDVEVQWIHGDVGELGRVGLEPGYTLLFDFGCIHGLDNARRAQAASGLTHLAAADAVLLVVAFAARRRVVLPRGMDRADVLALFGDAWELVDAQSLVEPGMPLPLRRAQPTMYRLRRTAAA
jgi:SAM-dependent methyltransferase